MHIFVVAEKHLLLCTNDYMTIIKYGASCHLFNQMVSITIQRDIQDNIEQLHEIVCFFLGGDMFYVT